MPRGGEFVRRDLAFQEPAPEPSDPAIHLVFEGKVPEASIQNKTPGAYRLFWCYGPDRDRITIIAITTHP